MDTWQFESSIYTKACREDAWGFWSDVSNHARMEPGVERIELDGPFETGTVGRTIAKGFTQEWELTDVVEKRRWEITGYTPDGEGTLSFAWQFEDEADVTRMIQTIRATGSFVKQQETELRLMEAHAPKAMSRLADELDRLAED